MSFFGGDRYREQRYQRPSMFGGFGFFPPVIKYLLISNLAIFVLQHFIMPSIKIDGVPLSVLFMKYFALNPIESKLFPFYPWQLVTYIFMHGSFMHIFFNMFALWMFGMELENQWGSKKFAFYYFMCGIVAGLANLFIAPLFTSLSLPTVGASGSVYGILVAFGMLFPNRPIFMYFLLPIKAKYFVIIYMVLEFLSVGSNTGIAHVAHLGGGLIGFIYLLLTRNNTEDLNIFQKMKSTEPKRETKIYGNRYYEKYNSPDDDISDADYYETKNENEVSQEKIDEILDKISKDGYNSLTEEEKKILFEASKKIN